MLKSIKTQFNSVFKRFPFSLIMALTGTVAGVLVVQNFDVDAELNERLVSLLITTILGFFLFIALEFYAERNPKNNILLKLACFGLLILNYFLLPTDYSQAGFDFILRSFLYIFAALMAVTFTPFFWKKEINGFWHLTKALFIRLFFTAIYTGVLYLGLILALYSADFLLGIAFDEILYAQLWIVVVGLIGSTFFLAGVPKDFSLLEKEKDYPKGLKAFSQFILIPLLTLYAFILYSYTAKILFTGEWPVSLMTGLILFFCAASLITYFLIYPLTKEEKQPWTSLFSTLVFILILPMVGMLFWSVSFRLNDYGLTVNRYYVILAGLWILACALYFLISQRKNLKVLPISLFFLAILTSFGPWGALGMSESSQMNRLEAVLVKNNLLVGGKVIKAVDSEVSQEDRQQLISAIEYLDSSGSMELLTPWFAGRDNLDADCLNQSYCVVQEGIGLTYGYYDESGQGSLLYFYADAPVEPLRVTGYDYVVNDIYYYAADVDVTNFQNSTTLVGNLITIKVPTLSETETFQFDLSALKKTLMAESEILNRPQEEMILETEKGKLILQGLNLSGEKTEGQNVDSFNGILLIKKP